MEPLCRLGSKVNLPPKQRTGFQPQDADTASPFFDDLTDSDTELKLLGIIKTHWGLAAAPLVLSEGVSYSLFPHG